MKRPTFGLMALTLALLALSIPAQPVILVTVQRVVVYDEARSGLNSDKKLKLRMLATGRAVNPCYFLDVGVHLKPLASGTFDTRELINDVATATAMKDMKVVYHCSLVEVLDGVNKGRRGWVVMSREVVGRYAEIWAQPEPVVDTAR